MGRARDVPGAAARRLAAHLPADRRLALRRRLRRIRRPAWLGTMRRTRPLSDDWGRDRGEPIDRHYIELFLDEHAADVHGRVLEVMDSRYTKRFGREVTRSDVLDVDASNSRATLVADLAAGAGLPSDEFDCFILTQTLQFIYDVRAAIRNAHRMLAPGGVLLVTVPTASRIDRHYLEDEYWRFTPASCRRLFGEVFGAANVTVRPFGNVLTTIGFLAGMATEELSAGELADDDPFYPLIVAVRARKQPDTTASGAD